MDYIERERDQLEAECAALIVERDRLAATLAEWEKARTSIEAKRNRALGSKNLRDTLNAVLDLLPVGEPAEEEET